jgi:ribonuclease Y
MSVVTLPTEDIKGRIIGREGRNIRSFEQVTGCDLLLEESSAVISSFDPIRRQAARLTLEKLIQDGRIHPARIEETHPISLEEVEKRSRAAGEDASRRAGVAGLKPAVLGKLGALEFKASLGQNVLEHSVEVAQFAGLLAGELGLNQEVARRAGLLHDIGKALPGDEPHALAGMRFLAGHGETEPVLNAVGAHHRELDCASPEAEVVILADMLSGSRPGARRSDLQAHIERLTGLEEIAQRQPGVREAYAIRAGKELRVIVEPEAVDDVQAAILAAEIAAQIDESGCVVTVIREVRRKAVSQRPSNGC